MFVFHIVICVSFGLARGIPANYENPVFLSGENATQNISTNESSSNVTQTGVGEPVGESNTTVQNTYPIHDVISVPSASVDSFLELSQRTSYLQDTDAMLLADYSLLSQNLQSPYWGEENMQSVQESNPIAYDDQAPTKVLMDIEMSNYEDEDNSLPNNILPLESLPNTYFPYVQENVPSLETLGHYDIDILNPVNTEVLLPNMRPTRSRADDFMAELTHDAMINNIIPTMDFVRGAEDTDRLALQTAVYPTGTGNGCGMPVFLFCNPNVIRGKLASLYSEYIQSPLAWRFRTN